MEDLYIVLGNFTPLGIAIVKSNTCMDRFTIAVNPSLGLVGCCCCREERESLRSFRATHCGKVNRLQPKNPSAPVGLEADFYKTCPERMLSANLPLTVCKQRHV